MLLASFLIVFVVFACGGPAGPAASTVSPCSGSQVAPRVASGSDGSLERPEAEVAAEPTPGGPSGEPEWGAPGLETPGAPKPPAQIDPARATDPAFGGARDLDDPFAVIGPAFSGMGFQSYSSGCDPFEDKYGTCL